jgi:arylsulfatase A-like enzyme
MVAALDDAVGRIVDTIDAHGLADNTLVVFISDNGGPTWQTTSSNGPLNGVKALVLEGGIRVPAVFRWTGRLPAHAVRNGAAMEFDVTTTAQSLAGVAIRPDQDGVNLMPYLEGRRSGDAHDRLYWRANEQGAMRMGKWKMVKIYDDYYLFDLHDDIGERRNLAEVYPAKLKELQDDWRTWSASMMAPQWGSAVRTGPQGAVRGEALKALVRRYIDGLPVSPETLLYGGGPQD